MLTTSQPSEGRAGPPDPPRASLPCRHKLPHDLPSWVSDGSVFFITINCLQRGENQLCLPAIASSIRESVIFRQRLGHWWIHLLVLMPDHLHLLAAFPREKAMRQVVFKWKEFVAKHLGLRWQRDFFDHRLRNDENYIEKAHYLRMNPVRKGLCHAIEEWPFAWADFHAFDNGGSGGPALPAYHTADGGSGGPALPTSFTI